MSERMTAQLVCDALLEEIFKAGVTQMPTVHAAPNLLLLSYRFRLHQP